jgi:predicted nucleotide-binding protein
MVNDDVSENADVPKQFWRAEGHSALTQDWPTGDFDTWIDHGEIQLRAFGVSFLRADIEKMIPPGGHLNPSPSRKGSESHSISKKIFFVHGHAGEPREAVARFLEQLGLEPIILHEQANQGRTIIEKFEVHADVGFAVVLLTPDDVGGPVGKDQQPRARQNVVLELGYFIGRLTRARVCALKAGDIELPSDILGIVWTPFDAGWKQALATELKAAGYEIDWNKVMNR